MAALLAVFGREPRHGDTALPSGRRASDRDARERLAFKDRVERIERRLNSPETMRAVERIVRVAKVDAEISAKGPR